MVGNWNTTGANSYGVCYGATRFLKQWREEKGRTVREKNSREHWEKVAGENRRTHERKKNKDEENNWEKTAGENSLRIDGCV